MKTTIGRIVIYKPTPAEQIEMDKTGNVQNELPAVIVAVWSDTCVNLKVFADGVSDIWKTSVILGDNEGEWNWPVINKK